MEKLGVFKIRNNDTVELLEEIFRKDKFDTGFGIEDDVNYSEDTNGY